MGRREIYICDYCDIEISLHEQWINAMVYGASLHEKCWDRIGGPRLARLLSLDDIDVMAGNTVVRKAWGPA